MQLNAVSTVKALSHTSRYPLPDYPRGLSSGFPSSDMKLMPERIGRATAMARGARSRVYERASTFYQPNLGCGCPRVMPEPRSTQLRIRTKRQGDINDHQHFFLSLEIHCC